MTSGEATLIVTTSNALIPETCASVAESGIRTAEDFAKLPADAYLIGETLMRAEHPGEKLRELRCGSCGR